MLRTSCFLGPGDTCLLQPFPRQLTNVSSWKVFYGRHDHVQLVDGCRRGTPDTGIQVQEFIEDEQWRNGKPGQYQRPCPLLGQTPCPLTEHGCVHASPSLQLFLNPNLRNWVLCSCCVSLKGRRRWMASCDSEPVQDTGPAWHQHAHNHLTTTRPGRPPMVQVREYL